MDNDSSTISDEQTGRYFIPSLFLSQFIMNPPGTLLSLLMIEIGFTFGLQVGVVGQISATNSLVALFASFIMSALSVKYPHKLLLMTGILFRTLSAVTCAFSTNFNTLLFFFSLNGVGRALITPMTMSLTAEHLKGEKRTAAIAWILMSQSASSIIGSILINYISGFGGWRLPFLAFILPLNILTLILVVKGIPSTQSQKTHLSNTGIFSGYKKILGTKSALACLVATVFSAASIGGFLVYQASFFRQSFLVSTDYASLMLIGNALCFAFGIRVAGRFMRNVGSQRIWALAMILSGLSTVSALTVNNLWIATLLALMVNIQFGLAFTSANSLVLDQVPSYRGSVMSFFTAANNLGMTLGASFGGVVLLRYNYVLLGLSLGLVGFLAALIVYFWAHERI